MARTFKGPIKDELVKNLQVNSACFVTPGQIALRTCNVINILNMMLHIMPKDRHASHLGGRAQDSEVPLNSAILVIL